MWYCALLVIPLKTSSRQHHWKMTKPSNFGEVTLKETVASIQQKHHHPKELYPRTLTKVKQAM